MVNFQSAPTHKLYNLPNQHILPEGNYDYYRNSADKVYQNSMFDYISQLDNPLWSCVKKAHDDYQRHHPRALKSNTNLFYQGVITFGNEDGTLSRAEMDSLDQTALDQAALSFLNAFCTENGIASNSAYLVKHCDESQIHYHYGLIGYDFERHEVIRNRLNPAFCSALQNKIGAYFARLGFNRGLSKKERIERTLQNKGLTPDAYKSMSPAQKAQIKSEANVSHKTVRALHSELKNKLFQLENAIQRGQGLFDLVINSQPDALEAIKAQMAAEGDKIVSRFFTYAMRLHNEKADKTKAIKNLESTIEKLGQSKADIEREFMLYHEKRQRQLQAQYGVSADQDFDNLAQDASLLLIKKERLQREINELELEKQQRLGQDAAATDLETSAAHDPVDRGRTLMVNRGRPEPSLRM